MSNHEDKYISKLLLGCGAVIGGIMTVMYACFERIKFDDWYFWGIVASVLVCVGVYLISSAFVHKIKSDLIRKQKMRKQQRSSDVEDSE
ncbi:MAG TPA: hypothetical protein VMZ03_08135 [Chitinophagaceae bacterium]|nr:hypothetical protein [Chitinophagaceae bacterium]